eukprot:TRINITY_DN4409_c0_g2_i1.p1 TRINITY_DN4409_c0_g2~~TRINITY_DN4409_c0_g2_i1.p1  ORF type:complete len:1992 (+),score=472.15 TRINITY_DN4409_c0_g2_i1:132-6107(+)
MAGRGVAIAAAACWLLGRQGASCGEPDCNPSRQECLYYFDDGRFGDAYTWLHGDGEMSHLQERIRSNPLLHTAICNRENWKRLETCYADCPLQLEVTQPPELKMRLCVQDHIFTPDHPSQHLDRHHPVNGLELDFVAVGAPGETSRHGCSPEDFQDGKEYAGKLVFIQRGTCYFYTKFSNAHSANATAALMVNSHRINSIRQQLTTMSGPSDGFVGMPAGMTPRQYGDIIFEALDRGVAMRGKWQLSCPAAAVVPAAESEDDGCPDHRLLGLCDGQAEPQNRLCSYCPLWLTLGVGDRARRFCLFGNQLLPRHPRNNILSAWDGNVSREVAYIESTGGGCTAEEYAGVRGKVVIVEESPECLTFRQMRSAELAGAIAFIALTPATQLAVGQVEGVASFAGLPVHATQPVDAAQIISLMQTGTRFIAQNGTSAWALPGVFTAGAPGALAPTPAPTSQRTEDIERIGLRADFEWTVPVIISVACIGLLIFGIVLKAVDAAHSSVYVPDEFSVNASKDKGLQLPLHCVSTALSLSLLIATAVVVFLLVYEAGRVSTDRAMGDGEDALGSCHANSQTNVRDLADTVMGGAVKTISSGVTQKLAEGELLVQTIAKLYAFYDGSWNEFNKVWPLFTVQARQVDPWWLTVRTTSGFYVDVNMKTDDRDDEEREDGLPHVSVTNNGTGYDYVWYWFDEVSQKNDFWSELLKAEWPMDKRLTRGAWGDVIGMVRGRPHGFLQWHTPDYVMPCSLESMTDTGYFQLPLSVYTPLYGLGNEFLGAAEALLDITEIARDVNSHIGQVSSTTSVTANLTIVLYEAQSGRVVSSSNGFSYGYPDSWQTVVSTPSRRALALEEMTAPEIAALGHYVRRINGGHLIGPNRTGEYDQREEFRPQNMTVFHFDFEGEMADVGGDKYKAETRGTCWSCLGLGRGRGGGLHLDGTSTFVIYRNLSVDMPRVVELRNLGYEPFRETCYAFGAQCIPVHECPSGPCSCPGVPDGVCGEAAVGAYDYGTVRWNALLREPFATRPATLMMWIKPDREVSDDAMPSPSQAMRLFSDTATGGSNLRLFANGVLYVRAGLSYGCITEPVSGGPPVGEWTHVAAVIDRWNGQCKVYIDGKLHSEATLSDRFVGTQGMALYTVQPYYIGQNFVGGIDDLIALRYSASADEIRRAFDTGAIVRIVPKRRWLMQIAPLVRDDPRRAGVHWVVAAMIPRDDVMRSVDRNNALLLENLGVQKENTERLLRQGTLEAVFITIAIALLSVIIFFVFNDRITRPFTRLAAAMLDVAVLKTETFDMSARSVVAEINAMTRAMSVVCRNMRTYRSFLPQALLQALDCGENLERQEAPKGCVAICFTDIVSSTRLWELNPGAMQAALERHNDIVRRQMRKVGGYEVKTIGDSFMVSHESAASAVLFALRVHEALLESSWPAAPEFDVVPGWTHQTAPDGAAVWGGVTVRIGVGYGEVADEVNPMTDRTDYRGRECNLAARLEGSCPIGLVNISAACHQKACGDPRLKDVSYAPLQVTLKGIGAVQTFVACSPKLRHRLTAWNDPKSQLAPKTAAAPRTRGTVRNSGAGGNPLAIALDPRDSLIHTMKRHTHQGSGAGTDRGSQGSSSSLKSSAMTTTGSMSVTSTSLAPRRFDHCSGAIAVVSGLDGSSARSTEDAPDVGGLTMRNVDWTLASCTRTQGKVSTLLGSTAQVSWNVISVCPPFINVSLRFADLVLGDSHTQRKPVLGIACGLLTHGHVGGARQRFHIIAGMVPRAALALAEAAAGLGAGCLACYFPQTPPGVRYALRPVDVWAAPALQRRSLFSTRLEEVPSFSPVVIEQLIPPGARSRTAVDDLLDMDPGEHTVRAQDTTYYDAFLAALTGGAEELAAFKALNTDGDPVLDVVAAALAEHQQRYASASASPPYRIPAPFVHCFARHLPSSVLMLSAPTSEADGASISVARTESIKSQARQASVSSFSAIEEDPKASPALLEGTDNGPTQEAPAKPVEMWS